MVKVLLFPGVEGIDPIRPSKVFILSSIFLFEGGNIGGLTMGGLTAFVVFLKDSFAFFTLGSRMSLAPASEDAFLFFPNMPKKLLAKLPASLAAGVDGANLEIGTDLVLEGRLRPFCFRCKREFC